MYIMRISPAASTAFPLLGVVLPARALVDLLREMHLLVHVAPQPLEHRVARGDEVLRGAFEATAVAEHQSPGGAHRLRCLLGRLVKQVRQRGGDQNLKKTPLFSALRSLSELGK